MAVGALRVPVVPDGWQLDQNEMGTLSEGYLLAI